MPVTQEQLLAFAIYEIRLLLAGHLGNGEVADPAVKIAAHLAYALHNQADAILQGGTFDPQQGLAAIGSVDRMFSTNLQARLSEAIGHEA